MSSRLGFQGRYVSLKGFRDLRKSTDLISLASKLPISSMWLYALSRTGKPGVLVSLGWLSVCAAHPHGLRIARQGLGRLVGSRGQALCPKWPLVRSQQPRTD